MRTNTIGIVETASGLVQGIHLPAPFEDITIFKSIPYAAPPVGPLRWQPPQDPLPWSGVRYCSEYADICVQPVDGDLGSEPWGTDFYFMGNPPMSEDCLHLTVATGASSSKEKRPVFIWFHGGGSDHGYSYETEFNPAVLAQKGVVVVSVNHRLGPFGYMALPQLTEEQGKSGNYILMDNIKALEWVIANIQQFGGDPDCITVGGQSAGCMKSTSVAFSPAAHGHVKRVINQSFLNWFHDYLSQESAYSIWQNYLRQIGIDPDISLEELRSIDASKFIPKLNNIRIPGGYIYDGEIVPFPTAVEGMEQIGKNYDYLSGSNLGETHMKPDAVWGSEGFTNAEEFYQYMQTAFPNLSKQFDLRTILPVTDENVDTVSRRLASLGLTYTIFGKQLGGLMTNRYLGAYRKNTAPGKKTFTYLFSHITPARACDAGTSRDPKKLMAWHSSELWYTFSSLREGIPPARPWTQYDFQLADIMSSYWANFIKYGDPNGELLPDWPESDNSFSYLEIGDTIQSHTGLNSDIDQMTYQFLIDNMATPKF